MLVQDSLGESTKVTMIESSSELADYRERGEKAEEFVLEG